MASTVIQPIANGINAILASLAVTPALTAYTWPPGHEGIVLPAGVIHAPEVDRVEPDQVEYPAPIGFTLWNLNFTVDLQFDLDNAANAQTSATQCVEAFIKAIDGTPDLNLSGLVQDAKVLKTTPMYGATQDARPIFLYECEVAVEAFV